MLNASVDMLKHLGHTQHATAIENAIYETISNDKIHTAGELRGNFFNKKFLRVFFIDLGGTASSTDVIQNVLKHLAENRVSWYVKIFQPLKLI
jgi:isocitrate dehydrogenase (NAD+)